ncbi:MAG: carbohydrate binding domain-containing protein [Flavobacteriaceae bacterium]|nr:carbohydrate binding domain-containing protein [Flavobacteriaceae bacterium]
MVRSLMVLLISFFSIGLNSQDFYISDELGLDTNNGSEESPFKTINRGILEVEAGGTVYVMNGTYRNSGFGTVDTSTNTNMNNPHVVTINKSGTEGAYITLKNFQDHNPKIQFDGRGGIIISNDMNYVIIEGFEVEGPAAGITYAEAYADREYKVLAASNQSDNITYNHTYFSGKGIWGGYGAHHHIIISNNTVHDIAGSGIRFNDSDHITIEYNEVYNATWWTSSASSAIVYAETIALEGDNSSDVKMIMRGNLVYNNWNRIPFYVTQLPDNSGNTNPNYGTADYNNILDGQGLYVTRSDDGYVGTFLFENNVCVNNGKNGINFDNSLGASAIFQNNTLFYNGVHEIIQDLSVADGNPGHRGQKVGGIKANRVVNATVVNNIVVTRDNLFSALELQNISGSRNVSNNIFLNGKLPSDDNGVPYNYVSCCNMIDVDPLFNSVPTVVNGSIDISLTNFELSASSPAIDSGNPNFSPLNDINGNLRPESDNDAVSSTSFENSTDGWVPWGATLSLSADAAQSGSNSLYVSGRTANWHSPRIYLDDLLTLGETYTFYVSVKLTPGSSGTADLTIRSDVAGSDPLYNSLLSSSVAVSDESWTQLSGDYTHDSEPDSFWFYVKGPSAVNEEAASFYIDDFSLVLQGSGPLDFSNSENIVDIGAYEYIDPSLNISTVGSNLLESFIYPNPATNKVTISGINSKTTIIIVDLNGKEYDLSKIIQMEPNSASIDVRSLKSGLYFIKVQVDNESRTFKLLKQ